MKTFAWIAAIAVAIDALLSLGLELYFLFGIESGSFDFQSYGQIASSVTAISVIAMGLLAAFFMYFASRLRTGHGRNGGLRFMLIAGFVLLIGDILISIMSIMSSTGALEAFYDIMPVLFPAMNLLRGVLIIVLGVVCLMLANSSSGATQVIGMITFVFSIAAAFVVLVSNGMNLLEAFDTPLPSAISEMLQDTFSIIRWSINIFWMLLAATLASIAAGIRNA